MAVLAAATVLAGCATPRGTNASPTPTAPTTTTVTRTTTTPPPRTDISAAVTVVKNFVTGARLNNGQVPSPTDVLDATTDGDVTGRMTITQTAGKTSSSSTETVSTRNAGVSSLFELTIRTTSNHPDSTIDILHRPGHFLVDYLLTGSSYRNLAPTPWVTVPEQFGNGIGCVVPGRKTVCQVVDDLLRNQRLDPSMPTNRTATAGGVTTIQSAVTVRQLLALDAWQMRSTLSAAAVQRGSVADLDRTLIPVTLSYIDDASAPAGRPRSLTMSGRFTVAGVAASIDLSWSESVGARVGELELPVPTRALYTPLNSAQANALLVRAERGF